MNTRESGSLSLQERVAVQPTEPPPRSRSGALSYVAYDLAGSLCGLAALPFLPLLLLTRHGRGLGQRLGRLPATARRLQRPLWVHAASVGEVLAAAPLIEQVRQRCPGLQVLVSTTSMTGQETARSRLAADATMLLPADVGWIVDRTLRLLDPRCIVLVETEIWPALIRAARRRNIPVVLVSGRVSARAAARYAWVRWLMRPVLARISAFAMQSDADAARIIALGAPAARVRVVGSLKFARAAAGQAAAVSALTPGLAALLNERPLLVAASTHADEEQMVLDACAPLWADHPALLLVIAPRRPQRFDDVEQLLARAGVRHARRSRLHGPLERDTQVLLLDTLGELPNVLPAARAVFVGGTIAVVEGHNVLEPALFGKPAAFGPHTANVAGDAGALLDAGAATRVRDAAELCAEWRRLLARPDDAEQMGSRGRAVLRTRATVVEQTLEVLRPYLQEGG